MKAEVQKPGIFSRALSVLTYNWGLKLLALLLAILVYYSLKTERAQVPIVTTARDNGISLPQSGGTTDSNQK
jgi:hypothetical protein